MNAKRLRAGLAVAVLAALVGLGYLLGRALVGQRHQEGASDLELLPEVSQRIREFRRVKVSHGRKVWELNAREAEYFEDQGQVLVKNPEVAFFDQSGESIEVVGREGRVFVKGKELDRIELVGEIEARMGQYVIRTERAVYDHERDQLVSPGRVEISGTDMSLEGEMMVMLLKDQRVLIANGVTTTFRGAPKPDGPAGTGAERQEVPPAPLQDAPAAPLTEAGS